MSNTIPSKEVAQANANPNSQEQQGKNIIKEEQANTDNINANAQQAKDNSSEKAQQKQNNNAKEGNIEKPQVTTKENTEVDTKKNTQENPKVKDQGIPQENTQVNTQEKTQKNSQTEPNKNAQGNIIDKLKNERIEYIPNKSIITKNIPPRGLNNIGATCYMNSVLQCLYHSYDLSNVLLNILEQASKEKEKLNLLYKFPMTVVYMLTINELTSSKNKSISPYKFKEIIGTNKLFRNFEANDSKTLTLYVIDTLNRELNEFYNTIKIPIEYNKNEIVTFKEKDAENIVSFFKQNYNSIISELFYGLKVSKYQCDVCKNCVNVYQIFNIIECPIEKTFNEKKKNKTKKLNDFRIHIFDCFKLEEEPKLFNGQNQLYCEKCQKVNDGRSLDKIVFAPKMLILFLDRGQNNKFKCEVDFKEEMDINDYLEIKIKKKYELIGVIEHLGDSGPTGHFIANCKHFDGKWYIFSDSAIKCTGKAYEKYGIPYLLFYRRKD